MITQSLMKRFVKNMAKNIASFPALKTQTLNNELCASRL